MTRVAPVSINSVSNLPSDLLVDYDKFYLEHSRDVECVEDRFLSPIVKNDETSEINRCRNPITKISIIADENIIQHVAKTQTKLKKNKVLRAAVVAVDELLSQHKAMAEIIHSLRLRVERKLLSPGGPMSILSENAPRCIHTIWMDLRLNATHDTRWLAFNQLDQATMLRVLTRTFCYAENFDQESDIFAWRHVDSQQLTYMRDQIFGQINPTFREIDALTSEQNIIIQQVNEVESSIEGLNIKIAHLQHEKRRIEETISHIKTKLKKEINKGTKAQKVHAPLEDCPGHQLTLDYLRFGDELRENAALTEQARIELIALQSRFTHLASKGKQLDTSKKQKEILIAVKKAQLQLANELLTPNQQHKTRLQMLQESIQTLLKEQEETIAVSKIEYKALELASALAKLVPLHLNTSSWFKRYKIEKLIKRCLHQRDLLRTT